MGYSLSWVAVKADPKVVYAALDLQPTGQREEIPESTFCSAQLPSGWAVIVFNQKELKDKQLAGVSRIGETIHCFVEEHVMVTVASFWRDGRQIWRVTHDGQEAMNHLSIVGDVPPTFASIRDKYLAKQAAEPEGDVDHIFDIPVELARELTGFRHDQEISGASAEPFEVLAKNKKLWGLF